MIQTNQPVDAKWVRENYKTGTCKKALVLSMRFAVLKTQTKKEKTPDTFGHLRNEKHRCSLPERKLMCNIFQRKLTSYCYLLQRYLLWFGIQ